MKDNILDNIRDKLINLTLFALLLLMLPIILSSFYRTQKTGFEIIHLVTPVLLVMISFVYLFRNKIMTRFKIYTFLIFLFVNSFFAFYSYGLLSLGVTMLLLISVTSILLLNKKETKYVFGMVLSYFALFAYLYINHIIVYDRNLEVYATSSATWLTQFISFVAIFLIVYYSLNFTIESLQKALLENKKLYEKRQDQLEQMVTERTMQLEETMEALLQKEKMASLGSLVAGVAHEINTPLGVAITANSFLINRYNSLKEKMDAGKLKKSDLEDFMESLRETGGILEETLNRAAELVKSFKKISVNHTSGFKTLFNLTEYIHSVILTLKHEYKNTGHAIIFDESKDYWIESDPGMFSQLLTNLIMNALIHGFKDKEKGVIKIQVEPEVTGFKIIFSDNGRGIPESNLRNIFEPFFTTNRQQGGSGLGLSIVHNIVYDYLNGNIQVNTQLDQGTSFIISIPLELQKTKKSDNQ